MATSKFIRNFKSLSNNSYLTSGTLELLPYGNTYPTGALALTHEGSGDWKRDACPDGEYSLYYNGTIHPRYQRFWIGENRQTAIADRFNSNNELKTEGLEDDAVTFEKLALYALRDKFEIAGGTLTFTAATGTMAWGGTLFVSNGHGGYCSVAPGSVTIASLQAAYIDMDDDKTHGSAGTKTLSVDVWNNTTVLGTKDKYMMFARYSNSYAGPLWRLYIEQQSLKANTDIANLTSDLAETNSNISDLSDSLDNTNDEVARINNILDAVIPEDIRPVDVIISQGAYTLAGVESTSSTRCRTNKITADAKTYTVKITDGYYFFGFKSTNGLFDDLTTITGWTSGEVNLTLPQHFLFIFKKGEAGTDPIIPSEFSFQVGGISIDRSIEEEEIIELRFSGRIGTTGHIGRTALPFDNSTPKTFRRIFTLAQHCDYVRVGFINGGGNNYTIAKAAVASLDTTNNFKADGLTFTNLLFNGGYDGIVPPSPGNGRRSYLVSDWVALSSLTPSDDATKEPKIIVSAYIETAETITLMGKSDGTTDFTNWATHPTRPMVMRYNDGDCVTTPANFTSETNRSTSPIGFIQYAARGQVVTVFAVGDSIANGEGSGITYAGQSEAFLACVELSDMDGIAYDFVNLAWSGTTTDRITDQVIDILKTKVLPDIMLIPVGSPNDVATTISASHITNARQRYTRSVMECEKHNVIPIIWTWLATDPSVKDRGASDSLRRDYNDAIRALANKGVIVADYASVIDGEEDEDGQTLMVPAYTSDHIHPNDAGKAALKPLTKNAILFCEVAKTGSLIIS